MKGRSRSLHLGKLSLKIHIRMCSKPQTAIMGFPKLYREKRTQRERGRNNVHRAFLYRSMQLIDAQHRVRDRMSTQREAKFSSKLRCTLAASQDVVCGRFIEGKRD